MAGASAEAQGTTTVPVPAWPLAEDGEDVVLLKNGGMVRGYLEELLPGERARIRLVSGEVSVIPWARIDHVEQGKGPIRPAPAIVTLGAPSSVPPPPVTGTATVHLDGAAGVTVFQQAGSDWHPVCVAPCDRALALDGYYRLGGEGVRPSKIFRLLAKPGERLVLTVEASSETAHGLGIVLVTTSGIAASIAYLGFVASIGNDSSYRHDSNESAWGATLLGSGVLAVVGVGLLVANDHTALGQRVVPASSTPVASSSSSSALPAVLTRDPVERLHGERTSREAPRPAWQTAQRDLASLTLPRVTAAPLVALKF